MRDEGCNARSRSGRRSALVAFLIWEAIQRPATLRGTPAPRLSVQTCPSARVRRPLLPSASTFRQPTLHSHLPSRVARGGAGSSENLHSALCCCYASLHVHVLRSVCIVLRRPCRVSGRRVSVCACVSRVAPEPSPLSSPGGRAGGYRGVRCLRAEIPPLLLHPISLLPIGSIPTLLGIVATLCATGASASSRAELTALLGV